ncbi:MAG: thioredoxin family protein [Nanoarchaeota archaeon]|nr:thioredoxin family protein [Nanoarchaeota archaeon]MBU1104016.1 thioredoxin family protein [Nanoarchaeota archaeon]
MKKRTKTIGTVAVLIILAALILVLVNKPNNEIITISSDGAFTNEECQSRGLTDKVIMLESKYCGYCQETKPIFLKACESKAITPEILDLSEPENFAQLEDYKINILYTPTFLIGCNYYVSAKTEEQYLSYLDEFLTSQDE